MGAFVTWFLAHALYSGLILVLIMCGMGIPIPEEMVFLTAGYIGSNNGADIWILCACGIAGVMLGDTVPFYAGHHWGMAFLTRPWIAKLLKPHHIEKGQKFAEKHGNWAVFTARFVAGARMPAFFLAGAMGVKYWRFFLWDLAGALISCPVSIWLAYRYGNAAASIISQYKPYFFGALGLIILFGLFRWWRHTRKKSSSTPVIASEPVLTAAPSEVSAEVRK